MSLLYWGTQDTALQVGPHQCWVEEKGHLPQPGDVIQLRGLSAFSVARAQLVCSRTPGSFPPYPWLRAVEAENVHPGQGSLLSSFTTREAEAASHLLLDKLVSRMLNLCDYILPSARAYFLKPISKLPWFQGCRTWLIGYGRVDTGWASGYLRCSGTVVLSTAWGGGQKIHTCSEIGRWSQVNT